MLKNLVLPKDLRMSIDNKEAETTFSYAESNALQCSMALKLVSYFPISIQEINLRNFCIRTNSVGHFVWMNSGKRFLDALANECSLDENDQMNQVQVFKTN